MVTMLNPCSDPFDSFAQTPMLLRTSSKRSRDLTLKLILELALPYPNPPAEPLDGWRLPFWLDTRGTMAAAGMLMGVEAVWAGGGASAGCPGCAGAAACGASADCARHRVA